MIKIKGKTAYKQRKKRNYRNPPNVFSEKGSDLRSRYSIVSGEEIIDSIPKPSSGSKSSKPKG